MCPPPDLLCKRILSRSITQQDDLSVIASLLNCLVA